MAIFPRQSWFCYCSVFASTEQTDRATNKTDRIAGQLNSLLLFTVNDWLHSKMTIFKNNYISGPPKTRKSILEMAWVKNAIKNDFAPVAGRRKRSYFNHFYVVIRPTPRQSKHREQPPIQVWSWSAWPLQLTLESTRSGSCSPCLHKWVPRGKVYLSIEDGLSKCDFFLVISQK